MDTVTPMYGWNTISWRRIQRNVFKLQKRIYQASRRGDVKATRKLQRLLMKSLSARLLATRRVTQDNQGKKTAGVDGIKSLTPGQRWRMANTLTIAGKGKPVRRVWIPKAGTDEKRPLGIPIMQDRALQTLVKMCLEPEWEARFEANSYGFRPGRSCQDAIEAIFTSISRKAKYVLDTDIAKCFDRINHSALVKKLNLSPSLSRQLKAWLKSGVVDKGELYPTEAGTMQGGTISPLLANVALHGLETAIVERCTYRDSKPKVIRYADDLVILHPEEAVIKQCQQVASEWLREMGLELKPSKTRITHTLSGKQPGFDFLGFHIRQYLVGKRKSGKNSQGQLLGFKTYITPSKAAIQRHSGELRDTIDSHRHSKQEILIKSLNPMIVGWSNYYSHVISSAVFKKIDSLIYEKLRGWAIYRHPKKNKHWIMGRYWRVDDGKGWIFQPPDEGRQLSQHSRTPIRRHVKVQGSRSPYDGDWLYWSRRLGRHPEVSARTAKLLKRQQGKCLECGLYFTDGDKLEVDHITPKRSGGDDTTHNRQLLHRHCHQMKTSRDEHRMKRCG
jgi:RNA-directed DNA polymerase